MPDTMDHTLHYRFAFDDGTAKEFRVEIDPDTLRLRSAPGGEPPAWTRLDTFACSHCPLDKGTHAHCPVAVNLVELIDFFRASISHQNTTLTIDTPDRTYTKKTSLQSGVSSLIGIYMTTSGCPVMSKLQPMVRFHLPFATLEETKYRAIAMYLTAQYLRQKAGLEADPTLAGLVKVYDAVRIVNLNFCDKLTALKVKDASLNAISILDSFADFTTFSIDYEMQDELVKAFHAYLE
jgi:hypothetical protein